MPGIYGGVGRVPPGDDGNVLASGLVVRMAAVVGYPKRNSIATRRVIDMTRIGDITRLTISEVPIIAVRRETAADLAGEMLKEMESVL